MLSVGNPAPVRCALGHHSGCFQGYCCDERKGAAAGKVALSSIIVLLWGPTYLSSHTSYMRPPLKTLLTMIVNPFSFDLPHQFLALFLVGLGGLPVDQLVHLRITVPVIVSFRTTGVILIKILVGVVQRVSGKIGTNRVVLAHDLRVPVGSVDRFELAVDVNLLQLVDQDHRRITVEGGVPRRHLDLEPVVRSVAELLHDVASFGSVL